MSFNLNVQVVCPFCDEDVTVDYNDLDNEWQEYECLSCHKKVQIKINEDTNQIAVHKVE